MNVRIILALTVPVTLVLVIVGAILADGNVEGDALEIADELLGIIGVILGGIISGLLVSSKDKDGEE